MIITWWNNVRENLLHNAKKYPLYSKHSSEKDLLEMIFSMTKVTFCTANVQNVKTLSNVSEFKYIQMFVWCMMIM